MSRDAVVLGAVGGVDAMSDDVQSQNGQNLTSYILCLKSVNNYLCQNFVKFPPTVKIFGTKMAKSLCEVHLFSTSPNLQGGPKK